MEFSHLYFAYFFMFMAANLSLTHLVTVAKPFIWPFVVHDLFRFAEQMVFRNQCLQIDYNWLVPCIFSPYWYASCRVRAVTIWG